MTEDAPTSAFPWDAAMRIGFGVLHLSSDAFWAMTPRELDAAVRALGGRGDDAPGRSALHDLMIRFPDGGRA